MLTIFHKFRIHLLQIIEDVKFGKRKTLLLAIILFTFFNVIFFFVSFNPQLGMPKDNSFPSCLMHALGAQAIPEQSSWSIHFFEYTKSVCCIG